MPILYKLNIVNIWFKYKEHNRRNDRNRIQFYITLNKILGRRDAEEFLAASSLRQRQYIAKACTYNIISHFLRPSKNDH